MSGVTELCSLNVSPSPHLSRNNGWVNGVRNSLALQEFKQGNNYFVKQLKVFLEVSSDCVLKGKYDLTKTGRKHGGRRHSLAESLWYKGTIAKIGGKY